MWYLKLSLFILSPLGLLILALGWSPLWQQRHRLSIKQQISVVVSFVFILAATFFIKDAPIYERGQCFTARSKNSIEEEWQVKAQMEIIEYVVLKVGKKNYLVHSSQSKSEDYPIAKDVFTKASECNIIYKRQ